MDKKGEESWWIEIHGTCELEHWLGGGLGFRSLVERLITLWTL